MSNSNDDDPDAIGIYSEVADAGKQGDGSRPQ